MKNLEIEGMINNRPVLKKCSRLIMGSAGLFPDQMANAVHLLDSFMDKGGITIDTAHQYEGSEEVLGKWVELRKNRSHIQILSKGAHPDDGEKGKRVRASSISKDLHESLERLKTDYLDYYALHRDDTDVAAGEIIEALNEHIRAGKVHAVGVSNWTTDRIKEANDYADANGLAGFTFNSPNLSLATCNEPRWEGCVTVDETSLRWHENTQLPLLAWSSQAGGFFSGKFHPDNLENEDIVRVYYNKMNWERYHKAKLLAEKKNASAIQIALAYVLNQPFPSAAIIGPETVDELDSSLKGSGITLTGEEMAWLTANPV